PKDKCLVEYQFGYVNPSQACRVTDNGDTKASRQFRMIFAGKKKSTIIAFS
ncbi:hypothetical protein L915_16845, partial [Phytophthora nicotianae]